ncbi:S8 family serine peptidase [Kribbella sp. NPDC026611]|uniref:S8 family serine peptidase n=1 Tax=Kribbella sp. NPDC026611 TaxID=3154911 RepID=UPI0033E91D00
MIVEGLPLLGLHQALQERFSTVRRGQLPPPPERNRSQHAADVLSQLDDLANRLAAAREGANQGRSAFVVTAVGPELNDPAVAAGLAPRAAGSELLVSDAGRVVFRVTDDLASVRDKAVAYANEETARGKPRYNNLIARIEEIDVATIADLSLGEISNDIPDNERVWVEIWTRGGVRLSATEHQGIEESVAALAALTPDGSDAIPVFRGPERDVHVILATGAMLKSLPGLLPDVAEVHLAPVVFPIVLAEALDESGELAEVAPTPDGSVVVAIHDTGIDATHPYVEPLLAGAESVVPGELGTSDLDGHGTQMAGIAAYSSLADDIGGGTLHPDARLVSVRLLETKFEAGGDPERGVMWAERTTEAVAAAENMANGTPVVHNLSIGADNTTPGGVGRTAWSVAADLLGWREGRGRLLVVATGNAETITDRDSYPYINLSPPFIQQPGQAWNVLTVGGYTKLDALTAADQQEGYPEPLAVGGELSPHSRSGAVARLPIKPDIVMEAGNTAPGGGLENPEAQGLSILTLRSTASGGSSLLRRTYKTSPAAAAASNALARIAAAHPTLRPATWKALLTHTAVWPNAATEQFHDARDLLRTFGYGVPTPERALGSASNRPVMVYEGSLKPSQRLRGKPDRHADFIEIPFPEQELHSIGEARVRLAVTLSYFVEPTDNLTRRAYAGGRLRWDLQGPTETSDSFRARINKLVRDEGIEPGGGSYRWAIPPDIRSRGALQHDFADVSAAALADARLLAVYPVVGWWEDATQTRDRDLPYSVVVSVDLGDVDIDLHSLISQALVVVPPISATT